MSMKKKENVAAKLMEDFITAGYYSQMKQTEEKVKLLSKQMETRLKNSDSKRHEFVEYGMVGRFVAKKIYDTDRLALNEYLYDIGLLLHVIEMDHKELKQNVLVEELLEPFKLEPSFYIKPNFNKLGKSMNKLPSTFVVDDSWGLDDMASRLSVFKPRLKEMKGMYEQVKKEILYTKEMRKLQKSKERKPIPHQFGSLSLLQNPEKYDIGKIYEAFGEGILLDYGSPNAELLNQCITNGILCKKDIEQFKVIKDIRLDFMVMTLEDERRMLEMLDRQHRIAAQNRMGA